MMWRVVVGALIDYGVLTGDLEEMLAAEMGAVFIPCGLGHLIGMDTHDVGGYLKHCPPRIPSSGISKLRTARILEEGMVLTVEPGCYFIEALLQPALADPAKAKFFNQPVLNRFRGRGGVRLEDVVVVTATGVENYTLCPRTINEVEGVMAGGVWPPSVDEAPQLYRRWVTLDKQTGAMVPEPAITLP
uniref:Peptidase M24 domain-containing protein n=1 Tax=Haptolina ericina TaxID=156174 RepID=A0A7S3C2Y5_9EUKA